MAVATWLQFLVVLPGLSSVSILVRRQSLDGLSTVWRLESRRVLTFQWLTSFVYLCGVRASAPVMRPCSMLWRELGSKLRQVAAEIPADFRANSSIGS